MLGYNEPSPNLAVRRMFTHEPLVYYSSVVEHLAAIVQTFDITTHRINHYPVDKYLGNQWRFLVDRDLSSG